MIINGNEIRLRFSGTELSGESSASLSFNNRLLDATLSNSKGFEEVISGIKGANVSFDVKGLFYSDHPEIGEIVEFHYGPRRSGWEGTGIVENIEVNATSDEIVSYSGSIKVIGELTKFVSILSDVALQARDGEDILTRGGDQILIRIQDN